MRATTTTMTIILPLRSAVFMPVGMRHRAQSELHHMLRVNGKNHDEWIFWRKPMLHFVKFNAEWLTRYLDYERKMNKIAVGAR